MESAREKTMSFKRHLKYSARFGGYPEEVLLRIAEFCTEMRYDAREELVVKPQYVYLVCRGSVSFEFISKIQFEKKEWQEHEFFEKLFNLNISLQNRMFWKSVAFLFRISSVNVAWKTFVIFKKKGSNSSQFPSQALSHFFSWKSV